MVPPEIDVKLRLTLREGSFYYFTERSLTSSEPHYFIVVSAAPLTQPILILTLVTSKVEEVKKRRSDCPETLVELSPTDFDALRKPSIVDCNSVKTIPLTEFNERFVRHEIRSFDKDLPVVLRKALRKAIHASSIVPGEIKALINQA